MDIVDGGGACVFSEEGFGCGQVPLWRITRNRVTMSLSSGSEGLDWKQRSVGKILRWGRTGTDLCPGREGQEVQMMIGAWCAVGEEH